ncbi:hypothetical protein C1H46_013780 [Malus baccata]|uniref:Uncharacterized protein n=1 Tax=Malus baccata TaxID=106549 RepID=A0A540MP06_MALBA|nr:hypothetical protein C1H46_013780 [Malus baccata]
MEEEQYYRMQQRYVYFQELHDQQLEAQHLVQGNGNIASRLTCPTPRHPYFEVLISNWLEQSNQELIWNNYGERRCRDKTDPGVESGEWR